MKYQISAPGLVAIAQHEGIVLGPYKDSVGIWTYGIGSTKNGTGQDPATMPHVDTRRWSQIEVTNELRRIFELFDSDLDQYEARVNRAVKVPLKQHQFDALVSWDFNTGGATWRSKSGQPASLIRQINTGDMSGGTDRNGFYGWLKPPELKGRRKKERDLFRTGNYNHEGRILIYDAHGDGKMSIRASITAADLLQLLRDFGFGIGNKPLPDAPENGGFDLIKWIIEMVLKLLGVKR